MTPTTRDSAKGWAVVRWLFAAAFIAALILTGRLSGPTNQVGLLYLVFGSVAAALMSFTGREILASFKQAAGAPGTRQSFGKSAHFWEAAARNAWALGALGSVLNFMIVLSVGSGGIAGVADRMIRSFLVMLYGLVLAVVCLVPAVKLSGKAEASPQIEDEHRAAAAAPPPHSGLGTLGLDRIIGYALFAVVLVLTVVFLVGGQPLSGPIPIAKVLFHWPAVLVVVGGAIALALFMGAGAGPRAWTIGFAMTGLIGLLAGFIQALFGIVHKNVGEIAAACAFIISVSSFCLLGEIMVAAPLEDRRIMAGRRDKPSSLSRLFWAFFPIAAFIFLVLTAILVMTPMEKTVQ